MFCFRGHNATVIIRHSLQTRSVIPRNFWQKASPTYVASGLLFRRSRGFSTKNPDDDGKSDPAKPEEKEGALVEKKEETQIQAVEGGENKTDPPAPTKKSRRGSSNAIVTSDVLEVIVLPTIRPVFAGHFMNIPLDNSLVQQILFRIINREPGVHRNAIVGIFAQKNKRVETSDALEAAIEVNSDPSQLYQVGTMATLLRIDDRRRDLGVLPAGGSTMLTILTSKRIKIVGVVHTRPFLLVRVQQLPDHYPAPDSEEMSQLKAHVVAIFALLRQMAQLEPAFKEQIEAMVSGDQLRETTVCDSITTLFRSAQDDELQAILEETNMLQRVIRTHKLLQKELETLKFATQLRMEYEKEAHELQKKHYFQQQLKVVTKELGQDKDDKSEMKKKFLERLKNKKVPPEVQKVIDEELERMAVIEQHSMEYNVSRNYLDWLTVLPWGIFSQEHYDIARAESVLAEDHYGLDDVKQRILEIIAVAKLLNAVPSGKIICLIGPPGVGKTSVGKSIARALDRQFFRFSVGGVHDVAEIKGHRRTYVGALPGKLIQCLKKTGVSNPVILIDEIDKLGRGHSGDPAAALLEVLDPEQNNAFVDHYLDVPVDLSKVLFICTANMQDTIPGPLADRMDFIRLSGYVSLEKLFIVKKYLEPVIRKQTGITEAQCDLKEEAVRSLIRWYSREAGVRGLQKLIDQIYRKVALKIAKEPKEPPYKAVIETNNLEEFIGKPKYLTDRMYEKAPKGVVMGLAWSSAGGSTLYIESVVSDHWKSLLANKDGFKGEVISDGKDKDKDSKEGKEDIRNGGLFCTGQMGDVMKESNLIAYTVAKSELARLAPESNFFSTEKIHMHIPEGATPKDGPSAGITMVTSLLSLALNKPVRDIAMTGELTVTGKVLPIGGVKEKIIGARRSRVYEVIFPKANKKDIDELQPFLREGMYVHFVETIADVLKIAFGSAPTDMPPTPKED